MPVHGPYTFSTATGPAWTDPNNAKADDAAFAVYPAGTGTDSLLLTALSAAVPSSDRIVGVRVANFQAKRGAGALVGGTSARLDVWLTKDGTTPVGTKKTLDLTTHTSENEFGTVGGAADLWGTTLTYSEVNASTFGLVIRRSSEASEDEVVTRDVEFVGNVYFDTITEVVVTVPDTPRVTLALSAPLLDVEADVPDTLRVTLALSAPDAIIGVVTSNYQTPRLQLIGQQMQPVAGLRSTTPFRRFRPLSHEDAARGKICSYCGSWSPAHMIVYVDSKPQCRDHFIKPKRIL